MRGSCYAKLRNLARYSRVARCAFIAAEMAALGIECPCERTLYKAVAILNWCEENFDITEDEVGNDMDRIQDFAKSNPRPADIPFIAEYHASATMFEPKDQLTIFELSTMRLSGHVIFLHVVWPEISVLSVPRALHGENVHSTASLCCPHVHRIHASGCHVHDRRRYFPCVQV